MTDVAAEIAQNMEVTRDLLERAHLLTPDLPAQVAGLLTAAVTLIERQVGREMAPGVLLGLIGPTLDDWTGRAGPPSVQ